MKPLRNLLLVFFTLTTVLAAPVVSPDTLLPHHETHIRARQQGIDQPVSFQTETTNQIQVGNTPHTVTQTCNVTLTPIPGSDGAQLVREDKKCSYVVAPLGESAPPPSDSGGGTDTVIGTPNNDPTTGSTAADQNPPPTSTDSQVTTTTSANGGTTTAPDTAVSPTATPVISSTSTSTDSALSPPTSVSESASTSTGTESAPSPPPSVSESVSASTSTESAPSPPPSVSEPVTTPVSSSVALPSSTSSAAASASTSASAPGNSPSATEASVTVTSTLSDGSVTTMTIPPTAAQAQESTQKEEVPGRKLEVLPIGLGVFAGISVIALIVVGLVTYERTKYRKAFRQRKLAEAGANMGYGGMAESGAGAGAGANMGYGA